MAYWGWRPLLSILFICVLVTGCTLTNAAAPVPSPTSLPFITLTLRIPPSITPTAPPTATATTTAIPIAAQETTPAAGSTYIVRPGDTLLGIAIDFGMSVEELRSANAGIDPLALQVGQIISIPPPSNAVAAIFTPIPLVLHPPACEQIITGGLLCLGQVHNPYDRPLNGVRVELKMLTADNIPLHQLTTGIEQMLIPPRSSAPYSVILPGLAYDSVVAHLVSASFVDAAFEASSLDIVTEERHVDHNLYQVQVTLRNATDQPIGPARLILTVVDQDQQVVGLRIANSPTGFVPGSEQTLHIEAVTRLVDGPLQHRLYVEAQTGS